MKWASSASKVDKCVSIMNFCERSANIFMETADSMAKMARETLVRATLPNFHLPAAVEILTTGSYNRVPRCIRDRIVPQEPITAVERRRVLLQLNQVKKSVFFFSFSNSPCLSTERFFPLPTYSR